MMKSIECQTRSHPELSRKGRQRRWASGGAQVGNLCHQGKVGRRRGTGWKACATLKLWQQVRLDRGGLFLLQLNAIDDF